MSEIKLFLASVVMIILAATSVNLMNADDVYALSNYMTVSYTCPGSGEVVDRCAWGHSGCDISGQPVCDSDPGTDD